MTFYVKNHIFKSGLRNLFILTENSISEEFSRLGYFSDRSAADNRPKIPPQSRSGEILGGASSASGPEVL